ncbi:A/G-specific adenine glycosylase [Phycicoccus sp. SLBN-51]|uniref:A/G-specific adenine glycosylase n=1 Tax=Phycicoccus sp. SLBN-51 TaxID=2768447 RepID=UPI0011523F88|nr:A/G-specific adenine glycosylase [Phycicoccus sp. SLBN-51]TQJ49403.1 A/G-specific DNA-adenine glycosylase [Phycicoccus sp. SLBN-51]
MSTPHEAAQLHSRLLGWFAEEARELPWRGGATPWGVFVSEVMLQQTPVVRVEPVWHEWMRRWPTPTALAAEPPGEAVRAWGRLGYPRRALRLHAAATAMRDEHGGEVPSTEAELLTLPGVGVYTAAAVAAFAFGERTTVVDTNIRRVLARARSVQQYPAPALTRAELALAASLVPEDREESATWNVAVMELGALVCTARSPQCDACPIADLCAWRLAGRPAHEGPPRRGQAWHGTDRQARGALLAVLRESDGPVTRAALAAAVPDEVRRERCLDGLVADGLVEPLARGRFQLPGASEAGPAPERAGELPAAPEPAEERYAG